MASNTSPTTTPADEYARRLSAREAQVRHYETLHARIANARLFVAVTAVLIAWLAFARNDLSAWWLAVPVLAFLCLAVYHSRVLHSLVRACRAADVYRHGLARIEDRWAGMGPDGDRFRDPHHLYSEDLDLFGSGGLFQLLCTARTRMGEETIARWLLHPADTTVIQQRHAAISELRGNLDFREALAVLGKDAAAGVYPDALLQWAEAPNQLPGRAMQVLAAILPILAVAGALVWSESRVLSPFLVVVLIESILLFTLKNRVENVIRATEEAFGDLGLLSEVLARMEQESFASSLLQGLGQELSSHHVTGSAAIARLKENRAIHRIAKESVRATRQRAPALFAPVCVPG